MITKKKLHIHKNGGGYLYLTKSEIEGNSLTEGQKLKVTDE